MSVVVGYRSDEYGEAALEHGVARANATDDTLTVVNVTRDADLDAPGFLRGFELEQLRQRLHELVGSKVSIQQPVGADTAAQILKVVEDTSASLLVIGLRPRSPVGKFLMGSTAQQLLLDSSVPVLAVKPGQVAAAVL